jgi:hypothetical protein
MVKDGEYCANTVYTSEQMISVESIPGMGARKR